MNSLSILAILTAFYGPNFDYDSFCQNLYFQPNAIEKMEVFECDIEKTQKQIFQVKNHQF